MKSWSADRTQSRRKRAGSRRNKKLKNVGSFASDGHSVSQRINMALNNVVKNQGI